MHLTLVCLLGGAPVCNRLYDNPFVVAVKRDPRQRQPVKPVANRRSEMATGHVGITRVKCIALIENIDVPGGKVGTGGPGPCNRELKKPLTG